MDEPQPTASSEERQRPPTWWRELSTVDKIRWVVAGLTFAGLIVAVVGIVFNYKQGGQLKLILAETSTKYVGNFKEDAENLDKILAELYRARPAAPNDRSALHRITIITDQLAYGSVTAYLKYYNYKTLLSSLATGGTRVEIYAYDEIDSRADVARQFTEEDFKTYKEQSDADSLQAWQKIEAFFKRRETKSKVFSRETMTYKAFLDELMQQETDFEAELKHENIRIVRQARTGAFPVFVWYLNLDKEADERAFFSFMDATDESNEFTFFTRDPNLLAYLKSVIRGIDVGQERVSVNGVTGEP